MLESLDETIAAIASAPGGAARGILRVSGANVLGRLKTVFQSADGADLAAATGATWLSGSLTTDSGWLIPCDLYLWPNERSYTGQPLGELHAIGSRPLLEAALRTILRAGARLAEPGEFTLRAFLAGRLDLTQAEAVLGVIDAHDDRRLDVALEQLAGGLSRPLAGLRDRLVELLAHLEAGFDFADEDLSFITSDELARRLTAAADQVSALTQRMGKRLETDSLPRAVLTGWPNVGKSSLFNALSAAAGALVSHQGGTTRDYLTAEVSVDEARFLLVDTAGVEPRAAASDNLPCDQGARRAAQEMSQSQADNADLEILCLDASRPLNDWERQRLAGESNSRLVVLTKIDAPSAVVGPFTPLTPFTRLATVKTHPTSSLTGEGIAPLRRTLADAALSTAASETDVVAGTSVRCAESLRLAAESLHRARQIVQQDLGEELVATEIRLALDELGKVVGAVYTEDVLDHVFSRFCVGK